MTLLKYRSTKFGIPFFITLTLLVAWAIVHGIKESTNETKIIEQVIGTIKKDNRQKIRLIILPSCLPCYDQLLSLFENYSSEDILIIVGKQAAVNIIKKSYSEIDKNILFYESSSLNLTEYSQEKTYLFSSNGELLYSELLLDYLNRRL